ncbi:uncharacterized protein BP5553_04786 [Venustampulla echinocandica]|uniref:Ubiquitin-like protease family profile domain-containing protein n=1 Tax=Venustampulla echinocandica TaxID=2656787 RepID=A0A370TPA5_9HELO|nr:uncharacterized protein BP5553_04786 [Venustampulla echinocandica]RDL37353.1 hypothetical protein BP5553_04786 [Venustampulla echinocandica]
MSGRKRKASVQITRNSIPVLEPLSATTPHTSSVLMGIIQSAMAVGWGWCTSWCAGLYSLAPSQAYTSMTQGSTEIIGDTHIQSAMPRNDGATALKRQKTRSPRPASPDSVTNRYQKGGCGTLDIESCENEREATQRVDAFWLPPEPGLLRRKSSTYKQKPSKPTESPKEEQPQKRVSQARDYGASAYPSPSPSSSSRTSEPMRRTVSETAGTLARVAPTPESLSGDDIRKLRASTSVDDLGEQMRKLLGSDEEQEERREVAKLFAPSGIYNERRVRLAKERKIKEREAAIQAAKDRRLKRRSPLRALIRPMNSEWENRVNQAAYMQDPYRVITTSIGGTELRTKDFATLLGNRAWLNDEIINSYIEWIVDAANKDAVAEAMARGEPPSTVPKFIAHNSFFYQNLIKKGPSSTANLMKRKKAPGAALLEVDSVFVPICKGNHWTIGVVRPVAKTIEYFDSMGGDPRPFVNLMRDWLKFQLGNAYDEESWKKPRTACARQNNGYDCGVFVCTNAYCVAMGLDTSCYYETDMLQQRRNIAAVLMNKGFVKDFAWDTGSL